MSNASAEVSLTVAEQRQVERRRRRPRAPIRRTAAGRRAVTAAISDAGAEHEPRLAPRQPAHLGDAAADVAQRDRGAGDDAAGEAAAGLVVAGEQQVERADHHDGEHHAHRHLERHEARHVHGRRDGGDRADGGGGARRDDGRRGRARPCRSRRSASTVISPSVSKPRKSTRITLTTLRAVAVG